MTFDEVIGEFRGKETIEDAMLLLGKDVQAEKLRRLVVAWQKIKITNSGKDTAAPDDEWEKWEWLWRNAKYDIDKLSVISGMQKSIIEPNLQVLKGNRVIYPDGTVSAYATKILRQLMKSQLNL